MYHQSQSKFLLMWKILPVVGDVLSSLIHVIYASSVWNIKTSFCKWKTHRFLSFQTCRNMNISSSSHAFTNIKGGTISVSRKNIGFSRSLTVMLSLGKLSLTKCPNNLIVNKYSNKHVRSRNSIKNKIQSQFLKAKHRCKS